MVTSRTRAPAMLFGLALLASGSGWFVSAQSPQPVGSWAPGGAIGDGRTGAASVALSDGTTLIAGGLMNDTPTDTVLLYDPATNSLAAAGQLLAARVGHTATALEDGRVLVIGGRVGDTLSADVELFDPSSGGSTLLGQLAQPRTAHAAARIADGIVVVFGGANAEGSVLGTVESVNLSTGTVSAGPNGMLRARVGASATTLIDGRVLIAGGTNGTSDLRSAELYIPWSQTFEPASNQLSVARSGHTAVLLPHNGGVLIAGGTSNGVPQTTADLFLPAESPDPFSYGLNAFAATAPMAAGRALAAAGPGREGYTWVDGGGAAGSETYRFATIKTDKDDYAPGQTAVITGTGWVPGEEVRLLFQEDPAVHEDYELTVTADAEGNIYWDQWAPEPHDVGVRFYLLASDSRSRAQITFTDGNLSSTIDFSITPTSVAPGGTLNWSVTARCQDGGGPHTCASEGFTHDGPVQDGYTVEIQRATNSGFPENATTITVLSVDTEDGFATGTTTAPASGGPYFYRARHRNQDLPNSPVLGNNSNSWQPETSDPVQVTLLSDGTAPTTTLTVGTPKVGAADRFVTGASTFTLSCADNAGGSGCAATFYQLVTPATACPSNTNEALWIAYSTPFTLPAPDGEVRVCYFSRDAAGNREAPKFRNHVRDTAAPQTTATATANAASYASDSWTKFDVSVSLSAADGTGEAGVKEITYAASGATTISSTTIAGTSVPPLVFSAEGTTSLTFSAKDNLGNVESTKTLTIKIDKTAPVITDLGPTTSPNGAGWYNTDVTNRFRAADTASGLDAACATAFPLVAGENVQSKVTTGEGLAVKVMSDSCTDAAGNTATAIASAEFKIDKTAPTTTLVVGTPKFGTNDRFVTGATSFTLGCADTAGGSGCAATFYQLIAPAGQCPSNTDESLWIAYSAPFTLPAPDGEIRLCYFSRDTAGSRETPKSQNYVRDTTAPVTTATATANAASYASGTWTKFDVSVNLSSADGVGAGVKEITYEATGATTIASTTLAGTSVPPLVFSAEGTTTLTFFAKDNLGNVESTKTFTIRIDKTAPTITDLGPTTSPNGAGWYKTDVTNRFKAADTLSGLDGACVTAFPLVAGENVQSKVTTAEGLAVKVMSDSCTDAAGNTATAIASAAFKIDKTAPDIVNLGPTTQPNGDLWYNTDVTNRFKVTELLSGVDAACQAAFPLVGADRIQSKTTVGEGLAVSVISNGCADLAGNIATGVPSAAFKIDKTAPLVAIGSPATGNTIVLSLAVNGTASDNLSGVKSVTLNGVAAVYNAGAGTWATAGNVNLACGPNTLTAVATDNADLSRSASVTVTRLCFTFEYLQPLEQSYVGGLTLVSDGKYGRVIPVKGIVRRSGGVQTDADLSALGLTLRIGVNGVPCSGGAASDAVEEYADAGLSSGGTNLFRWTLDGLWIYNLDTKTPPGVPMYINNCYRLDAYVQDAALNKVKISESPYAIFRPVK